MAKVNEGDHVDRTGNNGLTAHVESECPRVLACIETEFDEGSDSENEEHNRQLPSPEQVTVLEGENLVRKENLQGPHPWRERLRRVTRDDGRRLTGIRDIRNEEQDPTATVERSDSFDRAWKDGRKLNHDEKINDHKIRLRLKAMPVNKKDSFSRKNTGPMVAKPVTVVHENGSSQQAAVSYIPVSLTRRHRKTSQGESAFTRNVVNIPTSSGSRRRLSPHNSFRQPGLAAGFYSNRRTSSPNTLIDLSTQTEVSKKRIAKVLRARLYLLQQMGPNTFMIGGDSPEHKFKVIIGPQTCTCGKGPHCVHLLFVMLRVFQVNETDPCLWAKTLKNFEVEALFRVYHDKRSLRLAARHEQKKLKEFSTERLDNTCSEEPTTPTGEGDAGSGKDEEDTCPICLLEMLEGESLLKCENGCQNRLHHHCISIWFEECRRQSEPLNCPLCRAQWKSLSQEKQNVSSVTIDTRHSPQVPPNTRASSPTPEPHDESRLPQADPIAQENQEIAAPWIQILGEELVACLFSRNWCIRETGLRHLSREVVATLLLGLGEGRSGVVVSTDRQATTHQMLDTCCSVLTFMSADPVYKVFVACLRTLRAMLSYTPCRGTEQRQRLQCLVKPILDTILLKSTDGNRRTSQLSISTILELAKGQEGELAVGREIVNPGVHGLGGLHYVIDCVTEVYNPETVQWQWILGRLYILERLLEEFSEQFVFHSANDPLRDTEDPHESMSNMNGKPPGYSFIIAISQFSIKAIGHSHTQVAKLARRLFLMAAHFVAHDPAATDDLEVMLANTEARLAPALRRKFRKIVSDNRAQTVEEMNLQCNLNNSNVSYVPVPSPSISPVSTPRCNSPESMKLPLNHHDDGQSEACSSVVVGPTAPPNTPRHCRRLRTDPEGCSDTVDSLDTSDRSETREEPNVTCVTLENLDSPEISPPDNIDFSLNSLSELKNNLETVRFVLEQSEATDMTEDCPPVESVSIRDIHPGTEHIIVSEETVLQEGLEKDSGCTEPSILSNTREQGQTVVLLTTGASICYEQEHTLIPGESTLTLDTVVEQIAGQRFEGNNLAGDILVAAHSSADTTNHLVIDTVIEHGDQTCATVNHPDCSAEREPRMGQEINNVLPHHSSMFSDSFDRDFPVLPDRTLSENPMSSDSIPPRSHSSSHRESINKAEVVSLCDAEASCAGNSNSSHRSPPTCICESENEGMNVKVRRSVSDVSSMRTVNTPRKPYPRSRYSRSFILTEDLDFRFSPPPTDAFSPTPTDRPVSFKSEVATPSPGSSPGTTGDQESTDYKCKEEVELEEALALAKALEVSSKQDPTPIVPGLTPTDREEVITIRIQPEDKERQSPFYQDTTSPSSSSQGEPKLYLENIHWAKGYLLGTGAYSTCYQARDVKTGVIMAVKQISFCRNSPSEQEKVIEAISEEIHMMARLNHPNVLRILGATKQGCHFNMFVEWMAGGSVSFLLDQYGAFSEPVLINYTQQIFRGLAYLHDNHILHRDLKGANLLTDSSGQRLRIGDFGAAARLASQATGAGEFQGQLLGTIAFMAPEVLRGESYGRSCDVWSVGCVMVEMLTRKPPWNAKDVTNHLKLIFKIATTDQPPPVPPNVSPPVKDVMLRCLELNREERPGAKDLLLHPLFTQYKVLPS